MMLSVLHSKYDICSAILPFPPQGQIVPVIPHSSLTLGFAENVAWLFIEGRMVSSKRDLSSLSSPQPLALRKTADMGLQAGFKDLPACYSVILGTHFQLCPWLFSLVKMKGVEAVSSCLLIFTPLPKVISLKGSMRGLRLKCSVTPVFTEPWEIHKVKGSCTSRHLNAEVGQFPTPAQKTQCKILPCF